MTDTPGAAVPGGYTVGPLRFERTDRRRCPVERSGVDMDFAIPKLGEILSIEISEMTLVSDALGRGGNVYPARDAGVRSIATSGPRDSKQLIEVIVTRAGGVGLHRTGSADRHR